MRHPCPVARCAVSIEREKAFCFDHWRKLPRLLQFRVTRAWKTVRASRTTEHIQAHRRALDEATRALEALTSRRPAPAING